MKNKLQKDKLEIEITDQYNKLTEDIDFIDKTKNNLNSKIKVVQEEQERMKKKIAEVKVLIEERKDKKDSLISGNNINSGISINDIRGKCLKILDSFIGETNYSEDNQNLYYFIEAEQSALKKLNDSNLNFGDLKKEYCSSNNISLNELYFTDKDGNIYLDNENIKAALFPLDNYVIKENKPIIKVVLNRKEFYHINEINENSKLKENLKPERDINIKEPVWKTYLRDNGYHIIHFICLIVFMFVWIFAIIDFRDLNTYNVVQKSFAFIREEYFNKRLDISELLSNYKKYIINTRQFPTLIVNEASYNILETNLFNQFNKPLYYGSILQQIADEESCYSTEDYPDFTTINKTVCINPKSINTTYYNTYNYTVLDLKEEIFYGNLGSYYNHGFMSNIPLASAKLFRESIESLENLQWIDSNCFFIQFKINYFNINLNSIIVLTISYEKIGVSYTPNFKVDLINKDYKGISTLIAAFIFAILTLLTSIYMQLRSHQSRIEYKPILLKQYDPYITNKPSHEKDNESWIKYFSKRVCYNIIYSFRLNLRTPNFLAFVTFVNMIFALVCAGLIWNVQDDIDKLKIDDTKFESLKSITDDLDYATSISCIVILLFCFEVFKIVNHFIKSTNLIFISIIKTLEKSFKFTLFVFIPFIFMSSLTSYFLYGDFVSSYYRFYSFHFIKSLTSLYRGSISNIDYDDSLNRRNAQISNDFDKGDTGYKRIWRDSETTNDITVHSDYSGFIIFTVIFYFIANFVIKAVYTAFFLKIYRDTNKELQAELSMENADSNTKKKNN